MPSIHAHVSCGHARDRSRTPLSSFLTGPHLAIAPHLVTGPHLVLLCGAAFLGGMVDAIAGGGGLITVPALLVAGLPPHAALGTNKGQALFGSSAAILRYRMAGLIDGKTARISIPLGFAGSIAGAGLALVLRPDVLRPVVLVLLVVVAALMASGRLQPREHEAAPTAHAGLFVAALALVFGAYDGFFGPGVGTFIIAAYAGLLHRPLARATADAKVLNLASNTAAAVMFASRGAVLWAIAVPMAVTQVMGGFIGAHLAVRRGERLIRTVVLVVVAAIVVWLLKDMGVNRWIR